MGDIYANNDFKRDANGNVLVDHNGNVTVQQFDKVENYVKLGSVLPKYNLGWRNDFTYGNIGFGAMYHLLRLLSTNTGCQKLQQKHAMQEV